ncbi:phage head closure protein [Lactiplantibacillus xiangfangensis]|nr:phage head closure protein [Lactiplantibacillus xiangfangensis]
MKMSVSRFSERVTLGSYQPVPNDNTGDYDNKFVPGFDLHCARYQRTMEQKVQIIGTAYEETIILAVRRNSKIDKSMIAQYQGNKYQIVDFSKDSSGLPVGYDLMTLKLKK